MISDGGGKEKEKEKRKGNAIERNEISSIWWFYCRCWLLRESVGDNRIQVFQLPLPGRSTQLFRYVDSRQYNLGIPVVMYQ